MGSTHETKIEEKAAKPLSPLYRHAFPQYAVGSEIPRGGDGDVIAVGLKSIGCGGELGKFV